LEEEIVFKVYTAKTFFHKEHFVGEVIVPMKELLTEEVIIYIDLD
jgi:hypothetical protein